MTISNSFLVRIVADTELGRTAAATTAGSFSAPMSVPSLATPIARLDPFNPDGTEYPDCAGGTTTNGYSMTRAWIWASKALFDTTTRRVLFVNSPHPFDAFGQPTFPNGNYNGYITLLTAYDEADNDIHVYESPFSYNNATWPRTVGHAFDNQCLVDRTLYKMTTPLWPNATEGWVQPQLAKIDIDQVTDSVASAREGEAYLGSLNAPWEWDESALTWRNPGRNLTAGALDYLPGSDSLVFFHKKWLSFCPISTGTWTQPIDLEAQGYGFSGTYVAELGRTTWPIHNIGHYNAASGKFVCGGGAYNPDGASNHRYQLDWISVDATTQAITKLDDSPVIMSVSETDMPTTEPAHLREAKVAACAGPNSVESLFFHDNGNVYGLNPFRPPGYQWRVVTTLAFEVDLCVPIDDYGVVLLFTSGANGTASMRVYKPPVAGDHTPPSIPLSVTATATSSSEITVTWSASTDPVIQGDTTSGVAGYRVYRNGTLVTPGPVGLVTTFDDTGLSAGTAYSYTVSAYDVAGNESEVSVADSATTDSNTGYTATHYVAPYASVSGAANDYADLGVASWSAASNAATPTTLGTAMARASGSNKVQVAPGVYAGINVTTGSGWICSFAAAHSGTSAADPLVFFAQYPAAHNYGNTALYSEIRRATVAADGLSGVMGPLAGSNYVVFDGFYMNEAVTPSGPNKGMFQCNNSTGTQFRRIAVDRGNNYTGTAGYNPNAIYGENTIDLVVSDCLFTGRPIYPSNLRQTANVELYNSANYLLQYNTHNGALCGQHAKENEVYGVYTQWGRMLYNRFNGVTKSIVVQQGTSHEIAYNLTYGSTVGEMAFEISTGPNRADTIAVNAHHNTFILRGSCVGFAPNATSDLAGCEFQNNIVYGVLGQTGYLMYPNSTGFLWSWADFVLNNNCYYRVGGTPTFLSLTGSSVTGLPNWQISTGQEAASISSDPLFMDAANNDYRLQGGSPAAAMGCYITGTEEIGLRANPTY